MAAERLQAHSFAAALLPPVQLIADEIDLLPQVADHSRGALRSNLDDRRDDLDHASVEVDGAARRQLRRFRAAAEERLVDEPGRRPPDLLGDDFLVIDEDFELGLQSDDGHLELIPVGETGIVDSQWITTA